ncbi:hypothetical protein [Streptomyces noursei]|uniref:hypothetical protein n=1 Tax=Streptomyces noursei TaxID=1971 RepID=UPI0035DE15F4
MFLLVGRAKASSGARRPGHVVSHPAQRKPRSEWLDVDLGCECRTNMWRGVPAPEEPTEVLRRRPPDGSPGDAGRRAGIGWM